MYEPLIKAFNDALHHLSALNVPGLPEFQEGRDIVFASSAKRYIKSETSRQGGYKPDLILVKWDVFKTVFKRDGADYSESYESDLCAGPGPAGSDWFVWRNLLSTVEVKLGDSRSAKKTTSENRVYNKGFEDLQGDRAPIVAPKKPQAKPPVLVSEENTTRSCESRVPLHFFTSHGLQLGRVPISETRVGQPQRRIPNLQLRAGPRKKHRRGTEIDTRVMEITRRS